MKEEVPKNNIVCEPQLGRRNLYSKITYKENKKDKFEGLSEFFTVI